MITPILRFISALALLLSIAVLPSARSEQQQSIYQILRANGLPMGLLPKGVQHFEIDETGRFEVHLDEPCNAKFESEIHYERNVSGKISYGLIHGLSGVTAQELFLWFPVKEIRVDVPSSGVIHFDVGVVFKQFSLSLFETPRDCTAVWYLQSITEVGNENVLAQVVPKIQSRKLRYGHDQDNLGINDM